MSGAPPEPGSFTFGARQSPTYDVFRLPKRHLLSEPLDYGA